MQGVRWWIHLRAWPNSQQLQGVRRLERVRSRPHSQPVPGLRGRLDM